MEPQDTILAVGDDWGLFIPARGEWNVISLDAQIVKPRAGRLMRIPGEPEPIRWEPILVDGVEVGTYGLDAGGRIVAARARVGQLDRS